MKTTILRVLLVGMLIYVANVYRLYKRGETSAADALTMCIFQKNTGAYQP